ncbi:possible transmembrane protein [Thiobacillus denitrificans ATCC 25259]|uniref:Possible transmembrane protein n=1 Tax=Thiobacillus denitrificans (strain ATCC 25259 / T1) TaxID=292415 RepID=Q3SGZ6_THIDA|nr:EI24 domain-containing protein [Thiobacillus denitrificans]AAZ98097.1 possible transmembrane protein [Thiobacillus denitrificans ATCC 25259]
MSTVIAAAAGALRDLFSLRVLWIIVWPILVATLLWLGLGVAFWETFSGWIAEALVWSGIDTWLTELQPQWIAHGLQVIAYLLVFIPLVLLTALVITAIFAMPALVALVAERHFPELARERGGGFVGSLWNALVALLLFAGLWVASLPLWLVGVGVIVPFIAAAYLNQRLFRYDAVADHASRDEMALLFRRERAGWWGLGLLTGLFQFVPVLNLLAPVFAALAFIHFGLARIRALRASGPG